MSAISVGIIDGVPMLDLPYEEDVRADTDMNIVMTGSGDLLRFKAPPRRSPSTVPNSAHCLTLRRRDARR